MVLSLTEDLMAIQATARNFARTRLTPNAARWDEEKIFPEAELREAAGWGLPRSMWARMWAGRG